MKFMKLGSKPDCFQTNENDVRYVATELATDLIVNVGDVKFNLHKFPLLSKSARLHKLVAANDESDGEVHIPDIPGGAAAFEICAKFCYGMTVTLNAYNVAAARCAAEYLEMQDTVEKGNLIYKIEVFLNSSIFCSWKDSIIVLQTTKSLLPWREDLQIVSRCIESIASRVAVDPSKVDWSYTYNRKKLPSENGVEPEWNGVRKQQSVPRDWWVEDLCDLDIDFYKRIITTILTEGTVSPDLIGEAMDAYASRKIPGYSRGTTQGGDVVKSRLIVETLVWMLPAESDSISCTFLLKLLKAASLLDCSEMTKKKLVERAGRQLAEASVTDLLISAQGKENESEAYDVDLVQSMVDAFFMLEHRDRSSLTIAGELQEINSPIFVSSTAKVAVAKLVDGYLAEIAKDPYLPLTKFVDLADKIPSNSRPVHDGLYRAIDMYLKVHPGLSKGEKKRICKLMDCKKLSPEACIHVAQNERLPLRVVVQVLFFEQARAATPAATRTGLLGNIQALVPVENARSHGSSRTTTTNTDEEWDTAAAGEVKSGKGAELVSINEGYAAKCSDDKQSSKMKGGVLMPKKIINKLWSGKGGASDNSSSDMSDSPGLGSTITPEETMSMPSRNRRSSVSNV